VGRPPPKRLRFFTHGFPLLPCRRRGSAWGRASRRPPHPLEIVLAPKESLEQYSCPGGQKPVCLKLTRGIGSNKLDSPDGTRVAAVSGGGIVASAAEAGSGGDKIQFSGARDPITIPEGDDLRERLAGSMELLDRGNSLSGALDRPGGLPPPATPRQGLSPRLLEQFDREKNWILNRPEDMTRMPTAEEVMQIWEYDFDRALGARGVTGDSVEKRFGRSQVAPSALNPDQSDSAVVLDYGLDRGFRSRAAPRSGLVWSGYRVAAVVHNAFASDSEPAGG